jgi:ATP-dependent exoDNAse (exonuclease V) beta subunit
VDYKTDRIPAEKVKERAADYGGQVAAYRNALSRVAGQNVTAVYLVFLYPRILRVSNDASSEYTIHAMGRPELQ